MPSKYTTNPRTILNANDHMHRLYAREYVDESSSV